VLEVRVDDRRRMYWREVVPPYVVRYLLPRLFCRIVRRATVIRELSASLTDFSEGNARATSGVSKTRFVPRRYSFKYFPRTPMPNEAREYSARSSSALPFDINHLFFSGGSDLAKRSHSDWTLMGNTLALKLDAFNLMQRVCRQITFPAT
jgi:hypothetical protein